MDLVNFREIAKGKGICGLYLSKWEDCISKKQLMDVALSAQGMDFLCKSISDGWGLQSKYIHKEFSRFLNGRYIHENENGYTSSLYCKYNGEIESETTAILIIDSNVEVNIPKNHICEVYVVGDTKINFNGEGKVIAIRYGKTSSITNADSVRIKIIEI